MKVLNAQNRVQSSTTSRGSALPITRNRDMPIVQWPCQVVQCRGVAEGVDR